MAAKKQLAEIGKKIRAMRKEKGMSQSVLAEKADMRRATIADIEAGKMNITIETLSSIVQALGASVKIEISF